MEYLYVSRTRKIKNKKHLSASELHTPALVIVGLIVLYFVYLIRTETRQGRRILEPVRSDPFRVACYTN